MSPRYSASFKATPVALCRNCGHPPIIIVNSDEQICCFCCYERSDWFTDAVEALEQWNDGATVEDLSFTEWIITCPECECSSKIQVVKRDGSYMHICDHCDSIVFEGDTITETLQNVLDSGIKI